jgi:hypothetical protein
MVADVLRDILPPPWLSAPLRRRWHELFVGVVDTDLAAEIYREVSACFEHAVDSLGDGEPYDEDGNPTPDFVLIKEAGAAAFQLHQMLGFPPSRLLSSPRHRRV